MRGVVSLAAALALPSDFPQRDLLLFLTFAAIVATLVGRAWTLPLFIRWFGLADGRDDLTHEEQHARLAAAEAARARLDELEVEYPGHLRADRPVADRVRPRDQPRQHQEEAP